VGDAAEEIRQWLGVDFDQLAEPQNRGRSMVVVDEPVAGSAHAKQRGSLNKAEHRGQRHLGIDPSRRPCQARVSVLCRWFGFGCRHRDRSAMIGMLSVLKVMVSRRPRAQLD
jgi:hypothetical protein